MHVCICMHIYTYILSMLLFQILLWYFMKSFDLFIPIGNWRNCKGTFIECLGVSLHIVQVGDYMFPEKYGNHAIGWPLSLDRALWRKPVWFAVDRNGLWRRVILD